MANRHQLTLGQAGVKGECQHTQRKVAFCWVHQTFCLSKWALEVKKTTINSFTMLKRQAEQLLTPKIE